MKNPIQACSIAVTPGSMEDLQDYIERFNGSDGVVANTCALMAWNLASATVEEYLEDIDESEKCSVQINFPGFPNDYAHNEHIDVLKDKFSHELRIDIEGDQVLLSATTPFSEYLSVSDLKELSHLFDVNIQDGLVYLNLPLDLP